MKHTGVNVVDVSAARDLLRQPVQFPRPVGTSSRKRCGLPYSRLPRRRSGICIRSKARPLRRYVRMVPTWLSRPTRTSRRSGRPSNRSMTSSPGRRDRRRHRLDRVDEGAASGPCPAHGCPVAAASGMATATASPAPAGFPEGNYEATISAAQMEASSKRFAIPPDAQMQCPCKAGFHPQGRRHDRRRQRSLVLQLLRRPRHDRRPGLGEWRRSPSGGRSMATR